MGVSVVPGAADPGSVGAGGAGTGGRQTIPNGPWHLLCGGELRAPPNVRKLYRAATATTGGTIYAHVPATKKRGRRYTMPVNIVPRVEGLGEARMRLAGVCASLREGAE